MARGTGKGSIEDLSCKTKIKPKTCGTTVMAQVPTRRFLKQQQIKTIIYLITAVCLPASSRVPADDLVQVKNKGEIANVLVTQGGGGETQGYLSGKKSAAIPNFSFCGVQFSLERSLLIRSS